MNRMARSESVITNSRTQDDSLAIETGSFATAATAATGSRLVIASYNIRYAVGSFLISGSLLRRAGLSRPRRRAALVARHLRRAALAFTEIAKNLAAQISIRNLKDEAEPAMKITF